MSKITQAKKDAKLKGKAAKTAEAKKNKKTKAEPAKPSVPNADRCCHCKNYGKIPHEPGHQCKLTGKPTPRKATCNKNNPKN